jgi:hypothetical protein
MQNETVIGVVSAYEHPFNVWCQQIGNKLYPNSKLIRIYDIEHLRGRMFDKIVYGYASQYVDYKIIHAAHARLKPNIKKLTAFQVWKKSKQESWTNEQFKQSLKDNDIIL